MNLYLRISEQREIEKLNLTATESNIMQYIYKHIDEVDNISVSLIADQCHCSTAAIHRFVKKFGCDGYKQFKTELIAGKKIIKFSQSRFQINMNELIEYIQSLDISEFKHQILKYTGKRIYIYGIGGSYVSAQYIARQLNRFEIDASAFQPADRSGLRDLADAIIFISHSGESTQVVDKANQVKLEKIPSFAITRENSSLANIADMTLLHNHKFSINNFNQKESQLATILLIEKFFYELN